MPDIREVLEQLTAVRQSMMDRRGDDPLFQFKPTVKQAAFIQSVFGDKYYENWFCAANRCLTPWTPLETGSSTRLISELIGARNFDVLSWDGENRCTSQASGVFLKGIEPAWRFHLDNGEFFEATCKHRVLTPWGWFSLGSLLSIQGDRRLWETSAGCSASYDKASRRYGQQPLEVLGNEIRESQLVVGALPHNLMGGGHRDVREPTRECIRAYLRSFPHASPDDPDLLSGLCDLWTKNASDTNDRLSSCEHAASRQPPDELIPAPIIPRFHESLDQWADERTYNVLPYPILLLGNVVLIGYQKIGLRPIVDFTVKNTHSYIACGVIHHNSGKSEAGAYLDASFARFGQDPHGHSQAKGSDIVVKDRATSIWVSSVTFNETRDVMQPKIFNNGFVPPGARAPFIPEREIAEWRVSDKILKLKNGSIIGFKSAEAGSSAYQGAQKDIIHFDEEHAHNIYNEACIRIGAGRRLRVYGTATLLPGQGETGGVTWVYSEILKPFLDGKRTDVGCFGASMYDNPHLLPEDIAKAESHYPPESVEGRIRIGGEWLPGLSGARAYPSFDAKIHVRPQPELRLRIPLVWCWDFNVAPMVTTVAQRDGNLFRFHKELWMDSGNVGEMCDLFKDHYPRHTGELWVYGDATGKNRTAQTGIGDYRTIQNNMRTYPSPVRLKIPETNPPITDRLSAVNAALRNADGESMVEIDPQCENLIADFEQVLRDARGGIKKVTDPQNPYFFRTHTSDGAGYWISKEAPVKRVVEMDRYRVATVPAPSYAFSR